MNYVVGRAKLKKKAAIKSSFEPELTIYVTYIPSPLIRWVSLADVHRKKISSFAKFVNDSFKVLHKSDKKWRSAATTKVQNQRAIPFHEIQQPTLLSVNSCNFAIGGSRAKLCCLV